VAFIKSHSFAATTLWSAAARRRFGIRSPEAGNKAAAGRRTPKKGN